MINVTGSLKDISGTAQANSVSFTLCGFGTSVPTVSGTGIVIKPFKSVTPAAGSFSISLYGNDAVTPTGTFYVVKFLDTYGATLFTQSYQFTGSGTIDLSTAAPYQAPASSPLNGLYQPFSYSGNASLPNTSHPIIVYGTGGSYGIALTLPLASLSLMAPITIKKTDSGAGSVFVACQGTDKIDGQTSFELAAQYKYVTLLASESGWNVIANN